MYCGSSLRHDVDREWKGGEECASLELRLRGNYWTLESMEDGRIKIWRELLTGWRWMEAEEISCNMATHHFPQRTKKNVRNTISEYKINFPYYSISSFISTNMEYAFKYAKHY